MSELQQFGGDWTIEKLDILTSYLDAYLIALKLRTPVQLQKSLFSMLGPGNF